MFSIKKNVLACRKKIFEKIIIFAVKNIILKRIYFVNLLFFFAIIDISFFSLYFHILFGCP